MRKARGKKKQSPWITYLGFLCMVGPKGLSHPPFKEHREIMILFIYLFFNVWWLQKGSHPPFVESASEVTKGQWLPTHPWSIHMGKAGPGPLFWKEDNSRSVSHVQGLLLDALHEHPFSISIHWDMERTDKDISVLGIKWVLLWACLIHCHSLRDINRV